MKKLASLMLTFLLVGSLFADLQYNPQTKQYFTNSTSRKINQAEYNNLVWECLAIAKRIVNAVGPRDFAPIAAEMRQSYAKGLAETGASIAVQFGMKTFPMPNSTIQLDAQIAQMEFQYNQQTVTLRAQIFPAIINAISTHLQRVGTSTALCLLADLQKINFNF